MTRGLLGTGIDDGEAEFKDHEMRLAIELAATQGIAPASQG